MHTRHLLALGLVSLVSAVGFAQQEADDEPVIIPVITNLEPEGDGDVLVMQPMGIMTPLESMNRWVEREPESSEAYFKRAGLHMAELRYEEAVADFSAAIRYDPGFKGAYLGRAEARRDAGRYHEALEDVRDVRGTRARLIEASILVCQRDWEGALTLLDRLLVVDSESERGYMMRARVRAALGDSEAASDDLVRAWDLGYEPPVWSVRPPVTALERRVMARMEWEIPREDSMEETADDFRVRAWVDAGSPEAIGALYSFATDVDLTEQLAPGARGLVVWAQGCAHRGDDEEAARAALHVYVSSSPSEERLMALMVYLRTGPEDRAGHWLGLIESGEQDARFAWALPELRAIYATRLAG